jgi:hypothetical protein
VDFNWSWGHVTFDDPNDAALLFTLLTKAIHIDSEYLYKAENEGCSRYFASGKEISPNLRHLTILDDEEMAAARKLSKEVNDAKEARKKAEAEKEAENVNP